MPEIWKELLEDLLAQTLPHKICEEEAVEVFSVFHCFHCSEVEECFTAPPGEYALLFSRDRSGREH